MNENKIIFKKYKPIKLIGKGAFSRIYSTIKLEDKSVFAMKVEKKNPQKKMLEIEAYHLYLLQGFGIPKLITFGRNKNYDILIESLLGKTLFEIFIKHKKPCDIINTCLIAIQLIERLEFIHSKNLIYRDVKPENFMIGLKDPDVLYIIDFGLCKKYRSSKTGKHLQQRDTKKFTGTLKYSSADVVKGKESSRKDDLISLGYVIIYLYKRHLPWNSDFLSLNKKTYFNLVKSKETNHNGEIFENIPEEITKFVKYAQNLKFEEDPDYDYMKGLFRALLSKNNYDIQKLKFSWIKENDMNHSSKKHLRTKSNPRFRILENLKKKRINSMQLVSENHLDNDKINNNDEKDIKNNIILNSFGHYDTKPNKSIIPFPLFKSMKDETKLEGSKNKNINNYTNINKEKKEVVKYQIKKILYVKNRKKPIPIKYNSLINKNRIVNNKINKNKNVYINNSNNIYLNFTNFKKNNDNNNGNIFNKMNYNKRNIGFNISNINENMYLNKTTNFDNVKNHLIINTNDNINNIRNTSRHKIRHLRYRSIFSIDKMEDSLYNSYNNVDNNNNTNNNNHKIYKSQINSDNIDINKNNI